MQIVFEIAGPNSRSLRVEQNANRPRELVGKLANARHDGADPITWGVAHVHSENVYTLGDQFLKRFLFFGGRAERADNFRFSHRVKKWKKIAIIYASHLFDHRRAAIDRRNAIGSPR